MMEYENIQVEICEVTAKVVINRPKVLNALNRQTIAELTDFFTHLEGNKSVRGVIITGAGEKAFVAGADITELATVTPMEAKQISERGQNLFSRKRKVGLPEDTSRRMRRAPLRLKAANSSARAGGRFSPAGAKILPSASRAACRRPAGIRLAASGT